MEDEEDVSKSDENNNDDNFDKFYDQYKNKRDTDIDNKKPK